ncbi:MAG: DUF4139 domain-containing protein [Spirochaetaceae bacterium]|jgi:hypothetical protein|nr:DUF4139 domain-containing protein [Spirochaetaceae bacterium]
MTLVFRKKEKICLVLICLVSSALFSQNTAGGAQQLPLKKISIFSSGVSYFEHSGSVAPAAALELSFNGAALNDALKSLVINDPEANAPVITYQSETTLIRTLQSLRINLAGNPGIAEILSSLRGEEIQITTSASVVAPVSVDGRIMAVEIQPVFLRGGESSADPALTISTANGVRLVKLKDIQSFTFKNAAINADLSRALDMIRSSNNSGIKTLNIALPGKNRRDVNLSYVIPSPVWKVSYRLDLNGANPFLQGWAIIDNDGDIDWTDVEISLVTGRPVSFIQNLYPPYYVDRPVLPLAIAGAAEARTYESGFGGNEDDMKYNMARNKAMLQEMAMADSAEAERPQASPSLMRASARGIAGGGILDTARGADAGDQFEFTLKRPVTLARQQSAMLPLVEGPVTAEKTLVFSGQKALSGGVIHPAISAQLTNNTGMKLPAGPITVFDGGVYAGDALLEFLPEGEKRIISYGDDLSVSGSVTSSFKRMIAAVTVSRGMMTLSRKNVNEKTYTIRNAGSAAKKLIIEHPVTQGAVLTEPPSFDEQTSSLYRFTRNIAAGAALDFTVSEETPVSETIALSQLNDAAIAAFSTNAEIPAKVRDAFAKALSLKRAADDAAAALADAEARRVRLVADEERIRNNLAAVGAESAEGQEYLRRLAAQDAAIAAQNDAIDEARRSVNETGDAYEEYLGGLEL